jgi:PAS fold
MEFFNKEPSQDGLTAWDQYTGQGRWDAVFYQGDATHPNSQWRWSSGFRQLLGFNSEQAFPNIMSAWGDRLHPEDQERAFRRFKVRPLDQPPITPDRAIYRLRIKDDSYRWFCCTSHMARHGDGSIARISGSLMDIHPQMVVYGLAQQALSMGTMHFQPPDQTGLRNAPIKWIAHHEGRSGAQPAAGDLGLVPQSPLPPKASDPHHSWQIPYLWIEPTHPLALVSGQYELEHNRI